MFLWHKLSAEFCQYMCVDLLHTPIVCVHVKQQTECSLVPIDWVFFFFYWPKIIGKVMVERPRADILYGTEVKTG